MTVVLSEHLPLLSTASDGIQKLRGLILELAVRGKLVPQDPKDEPASDLLKRIAQQRSCLEENGTWKKNKGTPLLDNAAEPFELPRGWALTNLASISLINPRNTADDSVEASFVSMAMIGKRFEGSHEQEIRKWAKIKQGFTHFAEGDIGVAKITPCFENSKACVFTGLQNGIGAGTTELHIIRPLAQTLAPRYVLAYLKAPMFLAVGETKMTGTAGQKRLPKDFLESHPFPLPPLAEQHRIVGKVDELMALCDRLEAEQADTEAVHTKLVDILLRTLTRSADANDLKTNWQRLTEHFDTLFNTESSLDALKQTILQLAVMGKLVPQDPEAEPASKILETIGKTRNQLYESKQIPKPKQLPPLDDLELPFSLPCGWAWCRLGDLCYQVSDGPHFSPQYVAPEEGVPFLSTRNVRLDGFDLASVKYVSRADHEEFCKRIKPERDDVIYTKGGTTGIAKVNDLDFEFSVWVHLAVLRIEKKRLLPRYVELALNSPHCYKQSQYYTQGISNFDLGLTRMIKITVPLPPLAEQHRIIAKIDELMGLCDRLKAGLAESRRHQDRLASILIETALEAT